MHYTIAEVAKMMGVQASALRYYEDLGLLKNVARDSSGRRIYTQQNIDTLNSINCFKGAGMSIAEIQAFFQYEERGPESIEDMMALLRKREKEVHVQFEQLFASYKHLLKKLAYYGTLEESIKEGTRRPQWKDFDDCDFAQEAKNVIDAIIQNGEDFVDAKE